MGNDLHPYWPRPVQVNADKGNVFLKENKILEIPVSWYLDDFLQVAYITGKQEGQRSAQDIFDRWKSIFDYACDQEEGACFVLTTHPQNDWPGTYDPNVGEIDSVYGFPWCMVRHSW